MLPRIQRMADLDENDWRQNDAKKQFARFIEQNLVDIYEPAAHIAGNLRELVAKNPPTSQAPSAWSNGSHQFHYDEDIKVAAP